MKILILFGSSRRDGNTELLTERILSGFDVTRVYLCDKTILPVVDGRHSPQGFLPVQDDYDAIIREVLVHDILIFSTPLYWYGMSGIMKNFVDRWSQSLRDSSLAFKEKMTGKKVLVVVCGGDDARRKGRPLIDQFHYIFDFMKMDFVDWMIAEGNKPQDVLGDALGLEHADELRKTLQNIVQSS